MEKGGGEKKEEEWRWKRGKDVLLGASDGGKGER